MAKNFLNDIRPADKSGKRSRIDDDEGIEKTNRPVHLPPRFREKTFEPAHFKQRKSRKMIWIVAVLVILAGGITAASYFASAKVTITQKTEEITLSDSVFNATLSGDDNTLSFKLVKLSDSAEKVVTGGTPTAVAVKSTGKVILYNNFSKTPQKFAIETRLITNDGKIYKTDLAVTVPGMKTEAGKTVPDSIEVGVHADQPGATYNIGPSDFKILGFKGTPKYDKFEVRSKTGMTGGASGIGIALSEADAKIAHEAALSMLTEKLVTQAKTSLPESAVLLPGSYVIREDADSGQTVADKNVMIVKGSLYGVMFNEGELAKKIAGVGIAQYDSADITIPELDSFTIDLTNKEAITDATSTVSFAISGKGHVAWTVPTDQILADLAGSKKRDVNTNLSKYPSVEKASVKVTPFWSMSLPKKKESITIQVIDLMSPSR